MKTILLGTDFMYNQNGDLIPIQINTAVTHNNYDRVEDDDFVFDLSQLKELILKHNFKTIYYIGGILQFKKRLNELCDELEIQFLFYKLSPPSLTVPLLKDSDSVLIIRSAYDTSAIIDDTYCRNRTEFLNLIRDLDFGSEFAFINYKGQLINNINNISYNNEIPNFIMKSVFPEYNRNLYPKLYNIKTEDELKIVIDELTPSYFLMPFYYNPDKLYYNNIVNIRSLNILISPDLRAITIGQYSKKSERMIPNQINNELLVDTQYRESFLTSDDINVDITGKEYIKEKLIKETDVIMMNDILSKIGNKIITIHS